MRAVVTGLIATYPAGGVAWDYGQYLMGLQQLGFDVVYLEDSGAWDSFDDAGRFYSDEPGGAVRFLADALRALPLRRTVPWHLRTADGRTFGISSQELQRAVAGADLLLNVSGGAVLREEYAACARTVLVDTDPGLNHFVNFPAADRDPGWGGGLGWRTHSHHFTYAELLGRPECSLPDLGVEWRPTRPPVVLDAWRPRPPGTSWTTVMSWGSYGAVAAVVDAAGRSYGAKEPEWPLVAQLPRQRPGLHFVAAVREQAPAAAFEELGWRRADPRVEIPSPLPYRSFVESSRAEIGVAKNVYVGTRSGWSSCRSVCYLAAGRPVVTQDTGFSEVVPTGAGLLSFSTHEEALAAVDDVEACYAGHAEAARAVAEEHYGSDVVLGALLTEVGM